MSSKHIDLGNVVYTAEGTEGRVTQGAITDSGKRRYRVDFFGGEACGWYDGEDLSLEKPELEKPEFNVGDVVQLKSGGPRMTVSRVVSDGTVEASWFSENGDLDERSFPAGMLDNVTAFVRDAKVEQGDVIWINV